MSNPCRCLDDREACVSSNTILSPFSKVIVYHSIQRQNRHKILSQLIIQGLFARCRCWHVLKLEEVHPHQQSECERTRRNCMRSTTGVNFSSVHRKSRRGIRVGRTSKHEGVLSVIIIIISSRLVPLGLISMIENIF